MSLTRQLFRDFRPLIRLLEDPLGNSFYGPRGRSVFDDPFFQSPGSLRPAVDLTEEGTSYVVEADLPGVKRENVEVRIGDGGQSVTIEGRIFNRRQEPSVAEGQSEAPSEGSGADTTVATENTNAVTAAQPSNQLSAERLFTGSSIFTRTVWLPRPVDGSKVAARLSDGVLTVTIPKAEDRASVRIPVE